jgi:glucan phosphoethanolaminetransferase (alkaline phosphatase superfamily)
MELDDLKQNWKSLDGKISPSQQQVLDLIRKNTSGPASQLKHHFIKGMIFIPILAVFAITEIRGKGVFENLLQWWIIAFCLIIIVYFILNYFLMSRMQSMEGNVKANMQRQVNLLKLGLKWRLIFTRGFILLFLVLLEVRIHVKPPAEPSFWYGPWRFLMYAGIFLALYFFTKFVTDNRYRKPIMQLEQISGEMEDEI